MKFGSGKVYLKEYTKSPPSRGAWIEITLATVTAGTVAVAPLAGGVD